MKENNFKSEKNGTSIFFVKLYSLILSHLNADDIYPATRTLLPILIKATVTGRYPEKTGN